MSGDLKTEPKWREWRFACIIFLHGLFCFPVPSEEKMQRRIKIIMFGFVLFFAVIAVRYACWALL